MATAAFDTLKFANTLKSAGVPEKQAEAQASVLGEALAVNFKELATKDGLDNLEQKINARFDNLEQKVNARFDNLEQKSNAKIDNLEQKSNAKIDNLEQKVNAKIDNLEQRLTGKIDGHTARFDGQITLVKWMLGLTITLNVGVLVRLFFVGAKTR